LSLAVSSAHQGVGSALTCLWPEPRAQNRCIHNNMTTCNRIHCIAKSFSVRIFRCRIPTTHNAASRIHSWLHNILHTYIHVTCTQYTVWHYYRPGLPCQWPFFWKPVFALGQNAPESCN
jgi:hypothetical protein